MEEKVKNKIVLFIGSAVCLITVILCFNALGSRYCIGIPMITEESLKQYTETTDLDISQISFDGEKVAFDWENNNIYISQSVENLEHFSDLQGEMKAIDPEYELYFLNNVTIQKLSESVQEGIPLTLIIRCGDNFQRVNVVITTLPVLRLKVEGSYVDEEGTNVVQGEMTLWNSLGKDSKSYHTQTSRAEWHMRGNSTRIFPKMSWKLNLKEADGQNQNLDLLGLGSDDDWILNPMSMDDTFVKEKLSQVLWNQLAANTNYNYPMSEGEYVEVVINGSYQGLYMLQRRVDAKYLKLNQQSDILLKGINTWETASAQDGYEIVSTPYSEEETYEQMVQALTFEDGNSMHIDNFVDISLFLQFLSGVDNYGYKNTFYVLRQLQDEYELYLVPWDTDLTMGVIWGYDYDESVHEMIERQELQTVRKYVPDIDGKIAGRWNELRKTIYSEENIFSVYENVTGYLAASGAVQRDFECGGLLHEGEDNWTNLQKFIIERLEILDDYYL